MMVTGSVFSGIFDCEQQEREGTVMFDYFKKYMDVFQPNFFIIDQNLAYRREVTRYLRLLQTTNSGKILLRYVGMRNAIILVPYWPAQEGDPVNAYADAADYSAAYPKNALKMKAFEIPGYGTLMLPSGFLGTGGGSFVTLKYHPAIYRQLIKNKGRIDPGDGPGEVLFHELVHAMRMMHGKFIRTTVTADVHMDDFEEFTAIVAANIYRSERGFTHFRTNHSGHVALPPELSTSEAYARKFHDAIELWFRSQQDFCLELANIHTAFNPLKVVAKDLRLIT
jgi:hypothetical protein